MSLKHQIYVYEKSKSNLKQLCVYIDMDIQLLKQDYETGLSLAKLADKYKMSVSKIYYHFKKNHIYTRSLSLSHITKDGNYNFFQKIDSEEKAYWLGFLYADGSITHNSMKLTLHRKDEQHLLKFKNTLKSSHNFINDRGYIRFAITNQNLYRDLIKQGCVERKTFLIVFPNETIVPRIFLNHFIRGYFDGDGCITYSTVKKYNYIAWRFEICSHLNFLKDLREELISSSGVQTKSVLYKEKRTEKPIFYIKIGGIAPKNLHLLYHYLYKNANVFLERKKEKFIEIMKLIENN